MNEVIEAAYDYQDENRNLLFQVIRQPGKKFLQRKPNGKGGWIWKLDGIRRVLYHLPDLIARQDEPAFIVEGEKDVERLFMEGLLATTNPSGAGKWRDEYSRLLEGRDIIIIPDNDEPGKKHGLQVAHSLFGKAASIKIIDLPGLDEKGDVSDWLDKGNMLEELMQIVESAPFWEPSDDDNTPSTEKDEDTGKTSSPSTRLVDLVLNAGVQLFHDEKKVPYAAIVTSEGKRIVPIDSLHFKQWLSRNAWSGWRKAMGKEAVASAIQTLSGIACFDGPEYELHVRIARHNGAIWVDLDGSRAVKVSPGGWEIVNEPPILFRTFPHQKPFPTPIPGGDPLRLLESLNIQGEDHALLLLAFFVVAFVPDIPIPSLVLHGVTKSGKSTLFKVAKDLIDPSRARVRRAIRSPRDFAIMASHNRALFLDNLTSLPIWLSDTICGAVTGEGFSTRTLQTNEDETVFEYCIIVGLGGINLVATKPDLLGRSLIISLDAVSPERYLDVTEFWDSFNKAYPHILGALFDTVAKAMSIEPRLRVRVHQGMVDFARWGAAAAVALGWDANSFMTAYHRNIGRQNQAAIDASLIAMVVIAFMEDKPEWKGPTRQLYEELSAFAETMQIDTASKDWPSDPSWLIRRINEVRHNLLEMGIQVIESRTRQQRIIKLRRVDSGTDTSEPGDSKHLIGDGNVTANPSEDANAVTDAVTGPDGGKENSGSQES